MTIGSEAIAAEALAADSAPYSSGTGSFPGFGGLGTQGEIEFRGARFRATETQFRFRARDSDGEEMLGTTDKDPTERVWFEIDLIDILRGASILSLSFSLTAGMSLITQELVSNGETTHMARLLTAGGAPGVYVLKIFATCSDGSIRSRSLKIRSREL